MTWEKAMAKIIAKSGARNDRADIAPIGNVRARSGKLRFLVLKHLRMSHLAQQHDIHDDNVVVPFAVEVGSPEVSKCCYC